MYNGADLDDIDWGRAFLCGVSDALLGKLLFVGGEKLLKSKAIQSVIDKVSNTPIVKKIAQKLVQAQDSLTGFIEETASKLKKAPLKDGHPNTPTFNTKGSETGSNPIDPPEVDEWLEGDSVPTVDRIRNVAQRSFDYAVENPRRQGLNRMQLGKDAEIQATRWIRKWAKRNGIDLSDNGLRFQVRGEHSIPDVVYEPAKTIMDFKLTPKAARKKQSDNFKIDFPDYRIEYIFGPGPWR